MNTLKRFRKIYHISQLDEKNGGLKLTGNSRATAIMGESVQVYGDQILLNLDCAMATEPLGTEDSKLEIETLKELTRMNTQQIADSGFESFFDQTITIGVRVDSPIGHQILSMNERGAKSLPIEVVDLTVIQRTDKATGEAVAGKYLFNYPVGGLKIYEPDFGVEGSKEIASNVVNTDRPAIVARPKRDYAAVAAKLKAINEATGSTEKEQPKVVATNTVMAKMLALGFDAGEAATKAPAIAQTISPENWAVANSAQDAAGFKAILGAFGTVLA